LRPSRGRPWTKLSGLAITTAGLPPVPAAPGQPASPAARGAAAGQDAGAYGSAVERAPEQCLVTYLTLGIRAGAAIVPPADYELRPWYRVPSGIGIAPSASSGSGRSGPARTEGRAATACAVTGRRRRGRSAIAVRDEIGLFTSTRE